MKTQESMENYLETIYVLNQKTGFVRSVDVALEMGFSYCASAPLVRSSYMAEEALKSVKSL